MTLVCLPLLLAGCGTLPKTNLSRTLVEHQHTVTQGYQARVPRFQKAEFLSFEELKSLVHEPKPGGALEAKLNRFFNRPIISNEAWYSGKRPERLGNESLGDFLRIATWNIEKSIHAHEAARVLASPSAYESLMDPAQAPLGSAQRADLLRQRERLASADVILLQEMDIGIGRSGYHDSARDIARALGMNYAYAPKQLEIDPVILGLEGLSDGRGGSIRHQPDPARYKGVFGLAILSRYPIKSARCFQLQTQPYDWHEGERKNTALLEDSRRFAAEIMFENKMVREMKVGGRIFFQADLEVPGLPDNTLSVIHNHLEIKARPEDREAQMQEILGHIRHIPHTVIMGGDHNSSRTDMSPTSATRVIRRTTLDSETWLGVGMNVVLSAPMLVNSGRILLNNVKNLHSPLAPHIPVLLPNRTRAMFTQIEDFRFHDGGRFDFRGSRARSINGSGAKLANSNEKAIKGHTPSFSVKRPIGPFGKGRLDWLFVKAPPDAQPTRSYRLAPHYGETLTGLVHPALRLRLSDHSPCVLDLPLQEPPGF